MQSAQLDAPTCWFCKIQYGRAMSGILGQARIGGILHSSDGVKLMFFSKHIGVANPVLEVLSMMQRFEAIFFAILLFVATMEADGKRMTLEKEPEPSNHQLGRKVDVGAKDGIDLTAVDGAGEDDSDVALLASQNKVTTESRHHFFPNESNPYRHNRP
ncbi:hypothetical protein Godav_023814 [Gossypium davidsonii]|uniref:Uncharacterized protein n=5 Tax=Gossypium TaxID=3633 RepID=A0A7J8STH1_GOSDV|nr:hypothetical protein [Gossypium davidsonii]MBA0664899.1 hypothetical protein [Gossypium klotzschianum]